MAAQEQQAERQKKVLEGIEKVMRIKHRTDGGRKFKKKPKEAEEGLKAAEAEKKLPPKAVKKRKRQEGKKTKKNIPPFCRYIEGIDCIYTNLRWPGIAEELKSKDKLGRPMQKKNAIHSFCKDTCLAKIMPMHQTTNFFHLGATLSKQISQIVGALNIIAGQQQPPPQITEKRHPLSPSTSLRKLAKTPETTPKTTRHNVE